jgi:hypothetical protein
LGASADVTRRQFGSPKAITAAWIGILAGPAAWILQLLLSYPLAQLSCHAGFTDQHTISLHVISLGCLLLAAFGGWTALATIGFTRQRPSISDGGDRIDRSRFMALLGLMTSALFALVILFTWVPPFFIHDCQ